MKILIVNHTALAFGGAELYIRNVVGALTARGWSVGTLFEKGASSFEFTSSDGQPLVVTYDARDGDRSKSLDAVRRWKPDVLMQNGLLDAALEASLLKVSPAVFFAHGFYGTCISGYKRFAAPSLQACHRKFGAVCLALYYPRRCGGLNPSTALRSYLVQKARNSLLSQYTRVCVASAALRQEYLRHGVTEAALAVLPLFPDRVSPDAQPPGPGSTDKPILLVGGLTPRKGGALLLRAAAIAQAIRKRPMEVQFMGEGPEKAGLARLAKEIGVRATFLGWCDVASRQSRMREASLIAIPSTTPETFAIVGLEAGCVGLPAVGFASGGVTEWLINGYSGISADGERPTVEDFADAIVEALGDPVRYEGLRKGAWEVARRFSLQAHINQLEAVLAGATRVASTGHSI